MVDDFNKKNLGTNNPLVHNETEDFAGGGTNPLIVSDYMSYGSFSGVDCKVVVHYPIDKAGLRAANLWKQSKEVRIQEERQKLRSFENAAGVYNLETAQARQLIQERIDLLNEDIRSYDEEIQAIQASPTTKTLAEAQSFSWSIYREKDPVRTLGSVYPRAFTRGPRSISGTMVFTIFYEHVLHEVMKLNLRYHSTGTSDVDVYQQTTMLPDQIPPLDLTLVFANEYGAISTMGLYGVEFFQEGGVFSIEDIYSESTINYVARDIDPMRAVGQRQTDSRGIADGWRETASDMLRTKQAMQHGEIYRRNPFI